MRVLLTKPWIPPGQRTLAILPLSSLYLGSYLKINQPDIDVKILDPDLGHFSSENEFCERIINYKPDVIGVTIFSHVVRATQGLFGRLRKKLSNTFFVGGGSHINAVREKAFSQLPEFDFFIYGEGEIGFNELCLRLKRNDCSYRDIKGLIYKRKDQISVNNNNYTLNLDVFDPINFDLINPKDYFKGSPMGLFHKGDKILQLITTRGCPFLCTFCASPINMGRKVRKRSTHNIIFEMEHLKSFGADEIHFMDDNFTFNKQHVISLCQQIISKDLKLHIALPNGVRLDKLDEEMLHFMKKAGFYHIGFGIEVGSDSSLKKIRKNIDFEKIKAKIDIVKKLGFGTTGFFILGFPFDTTEEIKKIGELPDKLGLDLASFGNFTPLPGTQLYDKLVKSKEITADYLPSFASGKVTYSPKGISKKDLESMQRNIIISYYLNLRRLLFIIKRLHLRDFKYVYRRFYQIIFRPAKQ